MFGGSQCDGSEVYNKPQNCSFMRTQCEANGYPNAICTTRQNPDEGVICAQNCSIGYHKAGIFNHTCQACSVGKYNTLWNQYECQLWSNCLTGQYISANGTGTSDRECSSCSAETYAANDNQHSCANWTMCMPGEFISTNGTRTSDRQCSSWTALHAG